MGYTWDLQIKVAKGVLLINLIIAIISIFAFDTWLPFIRGLAFGTFIGILNFRLLALTIEKSVQLPPNKAQMYAGSRYIIRYLITAVVLIVSLKADYINVIGTIIGLVSIKAVVLRMGLFNDLDFFINIIFKERRKNNGRFWS